MPVILPALGTVTRSVTYRLTRGTQRVAQRGAPIRGGEVRRPMLNRPSVEGAKIHHRFGLVLACTAGDEQSFPVAHDIGEAKAHERALLQSARRYRSLVEASGVIVYTSDSQARWPVPNAAWEAYTGQTWEE